jgi:hypothetical protein
MISKILQKRRELILKSLREVWESSQFGDIEDENQRLEVNFIARTYRHYQKIWKINFVIDNVKLFTKPQWKKMYAEESQ